MFGRKSLKGKVEEKKQRKKYGVERRSLPSHLDDLTEDWEKEKKERKKAKQY